MRLQHQCAAVFRILSEQQGQKNALQAPIAPAREGRVSAVLHWPPLAHFHRELADPAVLELSCRSYRQHDGLAETSSDGFEVRKRWQAAGIHMPDHLPNEA